MNHENRIFVSPSETRQPPRQEGWLNARRVIILCATVGIVGAVFLTGHSNHLIAILPYLLLLACPFMHLFMHRGHGQHGRDGNDGRSCH
jgi:hypothetical protein